MSVVNHRDPPVGGDGDVTQLEHITADTMRPERQHKRAVGVEHLDAVALAHHDPPVGGDIDGYYVAKPSQGSVTPIAITHDERMCAVGVEHVNVVSILIKHHNAPVGPDGNVGWLAKNPTPKREGKRTVGVEHLDAAVAIVGHGDHHVRPVGRLGMGLAGDHRRGQRRQARYGGGRDQCQRPPQPSHAAPSQVRHITELPVDQTYDSVIQACIGRRSPDLPACQGAGP